MARNSVGYTIGFAAAVCVVAGVAVSSASVGLKDRQKANAVADKQKKVLVVAGLKTEDEVKTLSIEDAQAAFEASVTPRVVEMGTGDYADDAVELATYDARKAAKVDDLSFEVDANDAKVKRVPNHMVVYEVMDDSGSVDQLILPIHGPGLWSTLYGFISLDTDGDTIRGITFYEHAETPGLGGEVDNPNWKALWVGRKVYDGDGNIAIKVKKGQAGSVEEDPNQVDGLSGATLTANGVTYTLGFWLSDAAFGPYLAKNTKKGG